jgi:hypothetical protein
MASQTYEHRIENERRHLAEQRNSLQDKYDQEVKARKELEEKLRVLDTKNRRPRSQNRGRGRAQGTLHANVRESGPAKANNSSNGNSNTRASPFLADTAVVNIQRRKSYLPIPSRPSTPIRPPSNREPGSSSSTLNGSVHSTFSQASRRTNESFSSTETFNGRSTSPGSLKTVKPSSPTVLLRPAPRPTLGKASTTLGIERAPGVQMEKPSWANIVGSSSHI